MYCLVQHQVITSDATEGKAWYHDRFNAMESILYIRRESMRICSAFGDESFYHHCQAMCDVAEEIAFNPADREHFPASWGHRWMVLEAKLLFASRASRSRDFYPLYDQLIENDEVLTSVRFIATWKRAHLAGKDGDITLARNLWRRIADGEFGTYGDRGRALEQIQQLQNQ